VDPGNKVAYQDSAGSDRRPPTATDVVVHGVRPPAGEGCQNSYWSRLTSSGVTFRWRVVGCFSSRSTLDRCGWQAKLPGTGKSAGLPL
jgi:hypothetical protein